MSRIYVIHENNAWVESLREAFATLDLPFEEWFLAGGAIPLDTEPPEGVFYNRMSASSHTRGHRFAPEQTAAVLAWLERYHRVVVNDSRALRLEVSKVAQYAALEARGISTPRTVAAVGREAVVDAARRFDTWPIIIKPNRGGSGRGVRRFDTLEPVKYHVMGDDFEESLDGVTLVQEFVQPADGAITRAEFVGGEFLYAVRVETAGSFELCPADPCAVAGAPGATGPSFTITGTLDSTLRDRYAAVLHDHGIRIGAFESITTDQGRTVTYDVNTNTNYNSVAEEAAGVSGMTAIARFLGAQLRAVEPSLAT